MAKSLNITCDAISSVEMIILALLSLGAIDALVPVIIILILIAAAAGLRGGGDLFALLGFGAIMQMASGFGAGGAGKGISKTTEFKEQMSSPSGGAKARMAGLGALVKGKQAAKKERAQDAYLKTADGQKIIAPIEARATTLYINKFLKDNGVKDAHSLNLRQQNNLRNGLDYLRAHPREMLVLTRQDDLAARGGIHKFFTNISKSDAREFQRDRPDSLGVGPVRFVWRGAFGPNGLTIDPTIRVGRKENYSKSGLAGLSISMPLGNFISGSRAKDAKTWTDRTVNGLMKTYEREHPGELDRQMRTQIRNEYEKFGERTAALADWRYRASNVPVVGMYGVAAASLAIAAMTPFHRYAPMMVNNVPLPPPTDQEVDNAGAGIFGIRRRFVSREALLATYTIFPVAEHPGDWDGVAGKARFAGRTAANFFTPRKHYAAQPQRE
jgi:hypothetical protein